ncbi:hypothetical protein NDU88_003843 [Pleurodeles waltl]|uniref:Uncharacterized protein n=1 Tax=Pleurodeles waltl TaxID=8319 RepID=A0AAV7SH27_PLEWA|nr:hypothetical protein NDU88_003843 [Pleurodeles waltl]
MLHPGCLLLPQPLSCTGAGCHLNLVGRERSSAQADCPESAGPPNALRSLVAVQRRPANIGTYSEGLTSPHTPPAIPGPGTRVLGRILVNCSSEQQEPQVSAAILLARPLAPPGIKHFWAAKGCSEFFYT